MAYRILNYQIEIMRSNVELKKVKNKNYEYALVISIVLYTGMRKWTSKTNIREMQPKTKAHNSSKKTKYLDTNDYDDLGNYKIVDINNYNKKELLESESFLSKIMLLEKSKSSEELIENIGEITKRIKLEDKETLERIITYALKNYFDEETLRKIINKIGKGVDEEMLAMVEMLKRERQTEKREKEKAVKLGEARGEARGLKAGRKKEKISLAKKMLKENFAIEIIEKITGLKREKFL